MLTRLALLKLWKAKNPPKLKGKSYHYTNKSGHMIYHPNAYRRAWGKPIYRHSTLRIEVGCDWLLNNFTFKNIDLLKSEQK